MASKMVEKSSLTKIMSAASLDTSVPERPTENNQTKSGRILDIPMSARRRAGASLTPSPDDGISKKH